MVTITNNTYFGFYFYYGSENGIKK